MYSRWQNNDGTHSSRCLHCFMTVGADLATEELIDAAEKKHICPEKALFELLEMEKIIVAARQQKASEESGQPN